MEAVLSIRGLNKYFGKRHILKNVTFDTYAGEIFGFLGPNGAGKTTTIKIAVGHLFYDEGEVLINGVNLKNDFERAMESVGGIVENPELYAHMTGMQNLMQYARLRRVERQRIDRVVELVGMSNRVNEKVKRYSLGMRQRLGVAMALLHKPRLLILDEPTNGLDPAGIKELREILKTLVREENIGVMVSSHLMSEMELMCDRVGIISNGAVVDTKTIGELITSVRKPIIVYRLKTDDPEKALGLLDNIDPENKSVAPGNIVELKFNSDEAEQLAAEVTRKIVLGGLNLMSLVPVEDSGLEEAFIKLTQSEGTQIE